MFENGKPLEGIRDIMIPLGQKAASSASTRALLAGNLDAAAKVFAGDPTLAADRALPANAKSFVSTSITTYDSVGNKHALKVDMWKTADDTWSWAVDTQPLDDAGVTGFSGTTGTFTFDTKGMIDPPTTLPVIGFTPPGADPVELTLDPGQGVNGLSQFAGASTAVLRDQDGYTSGILQNYSIDRSGFITGAFSNGVNIVLGQIALAGFNNPGGLLRVGDGMYQTSGNSGDAVIGFAGEGNQSSLTSGALEMSNVDLAQEFTNMIIAQRGFQANSRVISNSDEMLQAVVNLKR
jgi:flagellar hook protein FlgE